MIALLILVLLVAAIVGGLVLFTYRTTRKVEEAAPPAGRFVDVPGAKLHVVEGGQQGPTLLLIHGLGGQLSNFTYGVFDLLAAKHRVVAVDRPGSGYSTRATSTSAALGAQADALAALIDVLKLDRPVVVGHSLGGAVALALAQRHPEHVAGLALVAPLTHVADVPPVFRGLLIAKPWLRTLVAWTLAAPLTIAKGDETLAQVFGPEQAPHDFATRGGGLLSLRPGHFIAACADLVAVPEDLPMMVQQYGSMRLPVSILYGRSDGILDPHGQGDALVAELPGAELTLVDGGHMLPITSPNRTAQFISEAAERAWRTTKVDA